MIANHFSCKVELLNNWLTQKWR